MASAIVSVVTGCPGKAAPNIRTYSGTARIRASITSIFTGVSVSRIHIEPVPIEALAWASSEALRPSHPVSFVSAWPRPISGCDLREVNFPESLRLFASRGPRRGRADGRSHTRSYRRPTGARPRTERGQAPQEPGSPAEGRSGACRAPLWNRPDRRFGVAPQRLPAARQRPRRRRGLASSTAEAFPPLEAVNRLASLIRSGGSVDVPVRTWLYSATGVGSNWP